jgi:hypothetical protein
MSLIKEVTFGLIPIKAEGRISNPDDYTMECNCPSCQLYYLEWKIKFLEDQKDIRLKKPTDD